MPKKLKRKYHGKRTLLNGPGYHSTAAIVAEIEDTSRWEHGKDAYGEELEDWACNPRVTFQISDCTRNINLDLNWEDDEDLANNLSKIDKMIDALVSFKAGVELESIRLRERKEIVNFREAEKKKNKASEESS